jgi:WXG100 family type VII secretion target
MGNNNGDSQITFDFAGVQLAAGEVQTAITQIESTLAEIERQAAPLVATWTGDAKEAYAARQRAWTQASSDLTAILRRIKQAMDDTHDDFHATETKNASRFQ